MEILNHIRTILKAKICKSVCSTEISRTAQPTWAIECAKCSWHLGKGRRGVLEFFGWLLDFSWVKNTFPSKNDGKNFFLPEWSKKIFFLIFVLNAWKKNFRARFQIFPMFGWVAVAEKVSEKSVLLKIFLKSGFCRVGSMGFLFCRVSWGLTEKKYLKLFGCMGRPRWVVKVGKKCKKCQLWKFFKNQGFTGWGSKRYFYEVCVW